MIHCSKCNHDTKVIDTFEMPDGQWRRRECEHCHAKFLTKECELHTHDNENKKILKKIHTLLKALSKKLLK